MDLVPDALIAFGFVLVPGFGLCLASRIASGRSFVTFLALSFGLGYAGIGLGSVLTILLGVFSGATFIATWSVIAAAGWAVALSSGGPRAQARTWRDQAIADPWASAAASVVLLGVTLSRFVVDPVVNVAPTVLRYWADGQEIADAGRIPDTTLHWGTLIEPITSKLVLNGFDAGASVFLGRDPITAQAALLVVVAVGLVSSVMALFMELQLPRLAPAAALFLFANPAATFDLTTDLWTNLAENWGRLAAFCVLLTAVLAVGTRSGARGSGPPGDPVGGRRPVIVAGLLLAACAGTHAVAALFAVLALGALGVAILVVERSIRPVLPRIAAILGVAAILGGAILTLAPGDLGLEGAAGSGGYRALRTELDLPDAFDPTRFISTHHLGAAPVPASLGPADIAGQFAHKLLGSTAPGAGPDDGIPSWLLIATPVVLVTLAVWLLIRGSPSLQVVSLLALLLGTTILALGIVIALRYDLFAFEYFGTRRLFSYAAVPVVLIVIAAGEEGLRRLERRRGSRLASRLGSSIVVALAAVMVPTSVAGTSMDERRASELELLTWVRDGVPCEGRILADHRTLGTFEAITGHAGAVEGMGPHVRPTVLTLAIEEIFRARRFFREPGSGLPYLRERGVAAIVVAAPPASFAFGGYSIGAVDPRRLDQVPFLERSFENAVGVVYRVEGWTPDPRLPPVSGRPGFRCPGA